MLIVAIESPFKPSDATVDQYQGRYSRAELLRQNLIYARLCLLNALMRGEAPLASHLLYTQVWSEREDLRESGIMAGMEIHHRVDLIALYVDIGISSGMRFAVDNGKLLGVEQTRRMILNASDKDPRELLAEMVLTSFPYLEELNGDAQSCGRIRTAAEQT